MEVIETRVGWAAPTLVGLVLGLTPARALAEQLGTAGESCQRRADCEAPLHCVANRCAAEQACEADSDCQAGLSCSDGRCQEAPKAEAQPEAEAPAAPEDDSGDAEASWEDFSLDGNHIFAGLSGGPAASGWWRFREKQFDVMGAMFFGIRAGALFDRVELALELAPVTWVPDFDRDPNLSFVVSVGGYPKLSDKVFWPLRFGIGLTAVNMPDDQVYMQGRLDLIGVAFQYGHLLFELDLPSTRFHTEFDQQGIWGWLANLSVSYVLI